MCLNYVHTHTITLSKKPVIGDGKHRYIQVCYKSKTFLPDFKEIRNLIVDLYIGTEVVVK